MLTNILSKLWTVAFYGELFHLVAVNSILFFIFSCGMCSRFAHVFTPSYEDVCLHLCGCWCDTQSKLVKPWCSHESGWMMFAVLIPSPVIVSKCPWERRRPSVTQDFCSAVHGSSRPSTPTVSVNGRWNANLNAVCVIDLFKCIEVTTSSFVPIKLSAYSLLKKIPSISLLKSKRL